MAAVTTIGPTKYSRVVMHCSAGMQASSFDTVVGILLGQGLFLASFRRPVF